MGKGAVSGWHGVRLITGRLTQQSVHRLEIRNDRAYIQSTCQKQYQILLT